MQFVRDTFRPDWAALQPAALMDHLQAGTWLIEGATPPPPAHDPGHLLAGVAADGGTAVTLHTATLMQANLGLALIGWLAARGVTTAPLASLAVHELLLNAAIHGNLAVPSGPSGDWADLTVRHGLIADALADPGRAARLATVVLAWNTARVWAVVADQGAGYQPQPRRGERRAAGRGLLIANAAAQVEVLDSGRCTRLTFDQQQPAAPDRR